MLVKRRRTRPIPPGAEIIERDGRKHARWVTARGKTRTMPLNRRGDRVVQESRCWYVRLRDRETGRWREWKAYADKKASAAKEIEIVRRIERGEAGLIDREDEHRKTPLNDHLLDFGMYLEGKGNTTDHVEKTVARCRRIFRQIGAGIIPDVTSSRVEAALAELRRDGMSPSTSNHYLRALRNFMQWMVRNRRVRQDPLAGMRLLKITTADKRRRRRNLSDEEMAALVAAAKRSLDPFMGLSGPDRAMLYVVAANTGLRASELASLTPESFDLEGSRASVRCYAAYTKNGEEAVLPLRSDVAAAIRKWLADKPARQRLWGGEWASQRHGAEMIRIDLTAADVEYEDDDGRVADFHALRHTFISNLARAGVHPRNAQALARHSTIDLTMNVYTHVAVGDLHDDVESLPGLAGEGSAGPKPNVGTAASAEAEAELEGVISLWSDLPNSVRSVIAALARA